MLEGPALTAMGIELITGVGVVIVVVVVVVPLPPQPAKRIKPITTAKILTPDFWLLTPIERLTAPPPP
jgi:hypothetical protein